MTFDLLRFVMCYTRYLRKYWQTAIEIFFLLLFLKTNQRSFRAETSQISKTYDRVDWHYLRHRMRQMGFTEKWIRWVMFCVTTVRYKVSFIGSLVGPIYPTRGVRQGDPLSPYLFLLCVEGLSHSLKEAADIGSISGCQINSNAPSITHLLFADDSFLFFKATNGEAHAIKALLSSYEIV